MAYINLYSPNDTVAQAKLANTSVQKQTSKSNSPESPDIAQLAQIFKNN